MIKSDIKILDTLKDVVLNNLKCTFGEELTNDKGEIFELDNEQKDILNSFIKPKYYRVGCMFIVYLIQRMDLERKTKEYIRTYHSLQQLLENDMGYSDTYYLLLKNFDKSNKDYVLTYYEISENSYEMKEYSYIIEEDKFKRFLRKEKLKEIIE
jgi:hypothetical protein